MPEQFEAECLFDKEIIKNDYDNIHLSVSASKEKVEKMKKFRKAAYGE